MKNILGALVGLGLLLAGGSAQAVFFSATPATFGNGSIIIGIIDSCINSTSCIIEKTYNQIGEMEIGFEVNQSTSPRSYFLSEKINNNTGTPWTDFHWDLEFESGVEFSQDSNIQTFPNVQIMTDMIWADGAIVPNGGSFIATVQVDVTGTGLISFNVVQIPTIDVPEPGTLAIMGLGLVGLGFARRRKTA